MNILATTVEQTAPPDLINFAKTGSSGMPRPVMTLKGLPGSGPARDARPSATDMASRLDFSTSYAGFTSEGSRIVFRIVAPSAWSVKLAGDFTNWERNALDLQPEGNGVWQVSVPLAPGRYAYRYLLDGEGLEANGTRASQAVVVVI